jgi:hypothetical protein
MSESELPAASQATANRRHDLDALRAIAMLLGIALHAALSFSDGPWVVQDSQKNELFGLFFLAVHGFRMPLFFLVSGFFTAMLWRKRGLSSLIKHRAKRILLPCLLGLVTIVPAMNWVSAHVNRPTQAADGQPESSPALIAAVRKNDLDGARAELSAGADVNAQDTLSGVTPLSWAALHGHVEVARLLIEHDADLDVRNRDGARPLHAAAFLGHAAAVELLIESGADVEARDAKGATPADATQADWGIVQFITGILQLPKPDQKQLVKGQQLCRRLLSGETVEDVNGEEQSNANTTAGENVGDTSSPLSGIVDVYAELMNGDVFRVTETFHLVSTPVFHHLWFLWFLCWLVPIFAVYAIVAEMLNFKGAPSWLILSPSRTLWLLPLTMIPQWFMGSVMSSFGPDTSIGLIPQPHLLLYYGIFFGFGALYFDSDDNEGRLGRWWFLSLPFAVFVVLPVGVATTFVVPDRSISAIAQTVYVWAMTFGMIGLFRKFLSTENKTMRYISDSSYWLYVAHLPLVIWGQGLVRGWPMSPFIKFLLVCGISTGLLLISYQTLVRYTWLGRLLNGPRARPKPEQPSTELS